MTAADSKSSFAFVLLKLLPNSATKLSFSSIFDNREKTVSSVHNFRNVSNKIYIKKN